MIVVGLPLQQQSSWFERWMNSINKNNACIHLNFYFNAGWTYVIEHLFGSREDAARDVAERKAVLSLQHDIEGDGLCLASESQQSHFPVPEDESEDVWPAQVF